MNEFGFDFMPTTRPEKVDYEKWGKALNLTEAQTNQMIMARTSFASIKAAKLRQLDWEITALEDNMRAPVDEMERLAVKEMSASLFQHVGTRLAFNTASSYDGSDNEMLYKALDRIHQIAALVKEHELAAPPDPELASMRADTLAEIARIKNFPDNGEFDLPTDQPFVSPGESLAFAPNEVSHAEH